MHLCPRFSTVALALLAVVGACTTAANDDSNPFTDDQGPTGKADTAYQNPDGIEVEVDIEADVESPSSRVLESPVFLAQYATTYFRERQEFYLESLAEDATSESRVEWRVDGEWIDSAQAAELDAEALTHFRIKGVNAVLLLDEARDVEEGQLFEAVVPINPFTVMQDAGESCANFDGHITLNQTVYWYMWNPERPDCSMPTQRMQVTVSKMFAEGQQTYPEYDRLVADGKVTAVVLFGQIGDGPIDEHETGVRNMARMARWLDEGGFTEIDSPPVGRRFSKHLGDVDFEIDMYSPHDFSGLSDVANFPNFQRAVAEHEIVVYDGHSMLGASDFWSRPTYPDDYQIFIYGGCLGYEYYVRPVVDQKGGWDNLDLVSSVIEVTADANMIAGPFFAKLAWALEHDYEVSWRELLVAIRDRVGDSTFGASGIRDNCYSPDGSLCAD